MTPSAYRRSWLLSPAVRLVARAMLQGAEPRLRRRVDGLLGRIGYLQLHAGRRVEHEEPLQGVARAVVNHLDFRDHDVADLLVRYGFLGHLLRPFPRHPSAGSVQVEAPVPSSPRKRGSRPAERLDSRFRGNDGREIAVERRTKLRGR